jgi:hypothetical protein
LGDILAWGGEGCKRLYGESRIQDSSIKNVSRFDRRSGRVSKTNKLGAEPWPRSSHADSSFPKEVEMVEIAWFEYCPKPEQFLHHREPGEDLEELVINEVCYAKAFTDSRLVFVFTAVVPFVKDLVVPTMCEPSIAVMVPPLNDARNKVNLIKVFARLKETR